MAAIVKNRIFYLPRMAIFSLGQTAKRIEAVRVLICSQRALVPSISLLIAEAVGAVLQEMYNGQQYCRTSQKEREWLHTAMRTLLPWD